MLAELTATANAYATGLRTLNSLVKDFTAADWAVRDACGHDPRWLVGHLATYRQRLLAAMDLPCVAASWEAAFLKGSSPADVPADLDMQVVLAAFRAAHELIMKHWDELTPEALAKPIGRKLPNGGEDLGGLIHFLAWHEAYHLGQLALLRRLAGRPGLA